MGWSWSPTPIAWGLLTNSAFSEAVSPRLIRLSETPSSAAEAKKPYSDKTTTMIHFFIK
jgi:hypothetical protein